MQETSLPNKQGCQITPDTWDTLDVTTLSKEQVSQLMAYVIQLADPVHLDHPVLQARLNQRLAPVMDALIARIKASQWLHLLMTPFAKSVAQLLIARAKLYSEEATTFELRQRLLELAVTIQQQHCLPNSVTMLSSLSQLAHVYEQRQFPSSYSFAQQLYTRMLEIYKTTPTVESADTLVTLLVTLAKFDRRMNHLKEHIQHLEWSFNLINQAYGKTHWRMIPILTLLGVAHRDNGALDKAQACYGLLTRILSHYYGKTHWRVGLTYSDLAQMYPIQHEPALQKKYLTRALTILQQHEHERPDDVAKTHLLLASAEFGLETIDSAFEHARIGFFSLFRRHGPMHPLSKSAMEVGVMMLKGLLEKYPEGLPSQLCEQAGVRPLQNVLASRQHRARILAVTREYDIALTSQAYLSAQPNPLGYSLLSYLYRRLDQGAEEQKAQARADSLRMTMTLERALNIPNWPWVHRITRRYRYAKSLHVYESTLAYSRRHKQPVILDCMDRFRRLDKQKWSIQCIKYLVNLY